MNNLNRPNGEANLQIAHENLILSVIISALDDEIAKRSVIVTRAERIDVECIVRGYLTGSAWAEYKKNQTVFWQKMPAGLSEGYKFEEPLFTPTTKADQGHDENMQISDMESLVGTEMTAKLKDKNAGNT